MPVKQVIPLFLLFLIYSPNLFSQVKSTWCPEEQIISPMNGFLEDKQIDLLIFDVRDTKKYIVTCTGGSIKKNLIRLIKETYTSPTIKVLAGEDPSAEPEENKATIKIGILDYHVVASGAQHKEKMLSTEGHSLPEDFSEDRWKAITSYSVEISDYTGGRKKRVTKKSRKVGIGQGQRSLR